MANSREQRLADNEALFRVANERMASWDEQHADDQHEPYFCECSDTDCTERITLSRAEYEHVRLRSDHFVLKPGHEVPEVEVVVEQGPRWAIVQKNPEVLEQVRRTDPRRD
jgi:hypothetical protein